MEALPMGGLSWRRLYILTRALFEVRPNPLRFTVQVPDGMLPEDVSEKPTTSVFLVEQVASFSGASSVG